MDGLAAPAPLAAARWCVHAPGCRAAPGRRPACSVRVTPHLSGPGAPPWRATEGVPAHSMWRCEQLRRCRPEPSRQTAAAQGSGLSSRARARMKSTALFCMSRACCSMKRSTIGPGAEDLDPGVERERLDRAAALRARAMRALDVRLVGHGARRHGEGGRRRGRVVGADLGGDDLLAEDLADRARHVGPLAVAQRAHQAAREVALLGHHLGRGGAQAPPGACGRRTPGRSRGPRRPRARSPRCSRGRASWRQVEEHVVAEVTDQVDHDVHGGDPPAALRPSCRCGGSARR